MKILIVSSDTKSLIDFRGDLLIKLKDLNHRVIALAPEEDTDGKLACMGIEFRQLPMRRASTNPFDDIKYYKNIRKIIKEEKPDMVFSYAVKSVIYASLAAHRCGVNRIYSMLPGLGSVFSLNSKTSCKTKLVKFIVCRLLKWACRYNKRVIVQNPDDKKELEGRKIIASDRVVRVNSSGVNMKRFTREEYPAAVTFLMACRLLKEKGLHEYIQAADRLKQKYPDVRFLLIGPFDQNPDSITESELKDRLSNQAVEYLGYYEDVRSIIRQSSVFVLPSYYREGVPRSIQEAMAMGRPVITTDWIGCRETVKDGYNGFLVPVQNASALGASMEKFINDPVIVEEMGQNSIQYCREKFDVEVVNKQMLDYIDL